MIQSNLPIVSSTEHALRDCLSALHPEIAERKRYNAKTTVFTVSSHALDLNGTSVSQLSEAWRASPKALSIKNKKNIAHCLTNMHSQTDKKKTIILTDQSHV